MIYDIYFWKKPGERRMYSSPVCPAPDRLKSLREQGYKILVGHVDLPDEPEVALDGEVNVQTEFVGEFGWDLLKPPPGQAGQGESEWMPGGPLWKNACKEQVFEDGIASDCGRHMPCDLHQPNIDIEHAGAGCRVLVRASKGNVTGTIRRVAEDEIVVAWDEPWRGEGTFKKKSFAALQQAGSARIYHEETP
jgi:hypothetical protein